MSNAVVYIWNVKVIKACSNISECKTANNI